MDYASRFVSPLLPVPGDIKDFYDTNGFTGVKHIIVRPNQLSKCFQTEADIS